MLYRTDQTTRTWPPKRCIEYSMYTIRACWCVLCWSHIHVTCMVICLSWHPCTMFISSFILWGFNLHNSKNNIPWLNILIRQTELCNCGQMLFITKSYTCILFKQNKLWNLMYKTFHIYPHSLINIIYTAEKNKEAAYHYFQPIRVTFICLEYILVERFSGD